VERHKWSPYVLRLARTYLYIAAGALVLYFVLDALERHQTTIIVHGYAVPIEREEVSRGNSGPDD
jgi:hypothetical protein